MKRESLMSDGQAKKVKLLEKSCTSVITEDQRCKTDSTIRLKTHLLSLLFRCCELSLLFLLDYNPL
jgi:hypothetical protein